MPMEQLTSAMARARKRKNQLLASTIGQCMKPAPKASDTTPR